MDFISHLRRAWSIWTRETPSVFLAALLLTFSSTYWGGTSCGTSFLDNPRSRSETTRSKPVPLWRSDLRQTGLKRASSWNDSIRNFSYPWRSYDEIGFSGDRFLIAAYLTPEGAAAFAPRRIHAIVYDSVTGRPLGSGQWVGLAKEAGLFILQNGKFAVVANHRITLNSLESVSPMQFELKETRKPIEERWEVQVTPSRRSVVVVHRLGDRISVVWLDPDSLLPIKVVDITETFPSEFPDPKFDVSDESVAITLTNPKSGACKILLGESIGSMRTVFQSARSCSQGAQFISNQHLLVSNNQELYVIRSDGQVIFQRLLVREGPALYGRASQSGERFAIPICSSEGGSSIFDTFPRYVLKQIAIFEISPNGSTTQVSIDGLDLKKVSTFALSGDGHRLALVRDGWVEVYSIR